MIKAIVPTSIANATPTSTHAKTDKNPAVTRCLSAWNYAFRKEIAEDTNDHDARQAANDAFLRAMPPLCGLENICDFIACVNFAYRIELISRNDSTHYLAQARVALAAHSLHPKPQAVGRKSGGKSLSREAQNKEVTAA